MIACARSGPNNLGNSDRKGTMMADKAGDTFRDKNNKLHVLVEGKNGLRPVTVAGNPKVGDENSKRPPKK